jgi:sporulation integral membrane protein YtvI
MLFGIAPFLISWGIAFAVRPLSEHLHRKIRLSKKVLDFLLITFALLLVFSILFIIGQRIVAEIKGFAEYLAQNPNVINDTLQKVSGFFSRLYDRLDFFSTSGDTGIDLQSYVLDLSQKISDGIIARVPAFVGKAVMTLPKIIIFIIVSVISAFYFSTDLKNINDGILSLLSEKWQKRLKCAKDIIFDTTLKYLRSYFIIMLITFCLLLVGFLFIRVKYFLVLSVVIAIFDILPIVGVGAFLVPWGIFCLAVGDFYRGMGLLVLYAVIMIVRQVIEPKIIGVSLGIHPLLTLFSMYLGLSVLGISGMILGPIIALVAKSLLLAGTSKRESLGVR